MPTYSYVAMDNKGKETKGTLDVANQNEALTRLDAIVQTVVVSRTTTAQPGTPDDGGLWILPSGATGADWSPRAAGALMRAEGGGWTVVETGDGLIALVADADEVEVFRITTH